MRTQFGEQNQFFDMLGYPQKYVQPLVFYMKTQFYKSKTKFILQYEYYKIKFVNFNPNMHLIIKKIN